MILATRVSVGSNAGEQRRKYPAVVRVCMRLDRPVVPGGEPLVYLDTECEEGLLDDRSRLLRIFRDSAARLQQVIEYDCGPGAEDYHPDHQAEMQEAGSREILPNTEGGKLCPDDIPDRGPAELNCDIVIPANVNEQQVGALPLVGSDEDAELFH